MELSESPIGEGTYGRVFRGKGEEGEVIAVKDFGVSPSIPCLLEAALVITLRHENIIRGHGLVRRDRRFYLTMELAEDNLEEITGKGAEREKKLALFAQLLSAVAYLHKSGYHHGDIKPSNCLIRGGVLKLGDFGFSGPLPWGGPVPPTYSYAPPECFSKRRWEGDKVDVWSLGATLAYILIGDHLFLGNTRDIIKGMSAYKRDPEGYLRCLCVEEAWITPLIRLLDPSPSSRPGVDEVFSIIGLTTPPILPFPRQPLPGDCRESGDEKIEIAEKWFKGIAEEERLENIVTEATLSLFRHLYDEITERGEKRRMIQLLIVACLQFSCKLRNHPPDERTLLSLTADSYSLDELADMEMLVFEGVRDRLLFLPSPM